MQHFRIIQGVSEKSCAAVGEADKAAFGVDRDGYGLEVIADFHRLDDVSDAYNDHIVLLY